jgi:hypothetical protein
MAKNRKSARPPFTPPKRAKEEKSSRRDGGRKEFDNTNRGALFQNDKDGNEARPDMTGIVDLQIPKDAKPGDVVKFRIAAWERTDRNDNPYLSMTIQKADKQGSNKKGKGPDEEEADDKE